MTIKSLQVLVFLLLTACGSSDKPSTGAGNSAGSTASQKSFSGTYKGDITGLVASGNCTFEDNTNVGGVLRMICEIGSTTAKYSFICEMAGATTGYADMVESPSGNRMRVQIDWNEVNYPPASFVLTVNPFGPAPTQYRFDKQ
jgi:hypothetical protein